MGTNNANMLPSPNLSGWTDEELIRLYKSLFSGDQYKARYAEQIGLSEAVTTLVEEVDKLLAAQPERIYTYVDYADGDIGKETFFFSSPIGLSIERARDPAEDSLLVVSYDNGVGDLHMSYELIIYGDTEVHEASVATETGEGRVVPEHIVSFVNHFCLEDIRAELQVDLEVSEVTEEKK